MADLPKLLKNIEYLFIAAIVASLSYVVYFFLVSHRATDLPATATVKGNIQQVIEEFMPPQAKPYETYSKDIDRRDLFMPSSKLPLMPSAPSGQLPAHLKIVGIVMGNPSQVIVEDTNAQQTYFIDKNSAQAGISIDRIEKNKVFLNYQGQMIQITPQGQEINVPKQILQNNP